jgi:8-oxo-dGTP pyrophosphatase MutT (NUDIX family)
MNCIIDLVIKMDGNHLVELLNEYKLRYKKEMNVINQFLKFISNGNCFSLDNKVGHITASAFIIDTTKLSSLLTHHVKIKKWIQLGGHINKNDKNIFEAAYREAFEESSLNSLKLIKKSIFDIDIHKIYSTNDQSHLHYDIRILFSADKSEPFQVSKESIDLKWIPFGSFEEYNSEWSLMKMREKIIRHL